MPFLSVLFQTDSGSATCHEDSLDWCSSSLSSCTEVLLSLPGGELHYTCLYHSHCAVTMATSEDTKNWWNHGWWSEGRAVITTVHSGPLLPWQQIMLQQGEVGQFSLIFLCMRAVVRSRKRHQEAQSAHIDCMYFFFLSFLWFMSLSNVRNCERRGKNIKRTFRIQNLERSVLLWWLTSKTGYFVVVWKTCGHWGSSYTWLAPSAAHTDPSWSAQIPGE